MMISKSADQPFPFLSCCLLLLLRLLLLSSPPLYNCQHRQGLYGMLYRLVSLAVLLFPGQVLMFYGVRFYVFTSQFLEFPALCPPLPYCLQSLLLQLQSRLQALAYPMLFSFIPSSVIRRRLVIPGCYLSMALVRYLHLSCGGQVAAGREKDLPLNPTVH